MLTSFLVFADCGNGCCSSDCCESCLSPCDGAPFLLPRSQGRRADREIVEWQQFINQINKKDYSGVFYSAIEYSQTFRPDQITEYFFGSDVKTECCSDTLKIQGSSVANRDPKAWLADYFGLSPLFNSSITFCPKIKNAIIDLNWYLALDKWTKGLYAKLDMPLAWTQFDLGMSEVVKSNPTDTFVSGVNVTSFNYGYMSNDPVPRSALPNSFIQVMSGTTTFGDMQSPIKFGKMTTCKLTKFAIADLRATLGYNIILRENGNFGIFAVAAAPTGNRPNAWYLFEPMVGNGHHWELGGGFNGAWIFHNCTDDGSRHLCFSCDATITHLFKSKQCRSFDFSCKPSSRYMLLEEMGTNSDNINALIDNTTTAAQYQYKGSLIPAINWSTFCVDVSIAVQADVALKLGYVRDNWDFAIGYDFWARSGEKFCDCCNSCCNNNCCDSCCTCTPSCKQYALKGDAYVYGYTVSDTPYALSATENSATIHSGTNIPSCTANPSALTPCANPNVDNAYAAKAGSTALQCALTSDATHTSVQPILVQKCNLNMCKSPSAITHTAFFNIGYAWKNTNDRWVPFFGIGGNVEFAQGAGCCSDNCGNCGSCGCNSCSSNCSCNSCCNSCNSCSSCDNSCNSCCNNCCSTKKASISQWGAWLKGGVKFD